MSDALLTLHRRCIGESVAFVDRVLVGDLELTTPRLGWTLRDLVAHMTAQPHGFPAAAREAATPQAYGMGRVGRRSDWSYRAAAAEVLSAFAGDGVPVRQFVLPEIPDTPFTATQAISLHLLDYVVHTWDVARTLGLNYSPVDNLAAVALRVPDGPTREAPGTAYAYALTVTHDQPMIDRIVATLGRSPRPCS